MKLDLSHARDYINYNHIINNQNKFLAFPGHVSYFQNAMGEMVEQSKELTEIYNKVFSNYIELIYEYWKKMRELKLYEEADKLRIKAREEFGIKLEAIKEEV